MEPTYYASIHDLRLLLQRFAFEKSFSEYTFGGGRDSNITEICAVCDPHDPLCPEYVSVMNYGLH